MTRKRIDWTLTTLALATTGALAGGIAHLTGSPEIGDMLWRITLVGALVPLTISVGRALLRGDFGVDVIALLAMGSALAAGELLAGAIVAVMLSGGNALEDYAGGRAKRELTQLLKAAPRTARRQITGGEWIEVEVDAIEPGEMVLVRSGEVAPVDGTLTSRHATVDASTMTGESLPVRVGRGEMVRSGAVNAGEPFEMRATRPAAESSYAALVRLVEEAQRQKPPFTRLADRYAVVFLPVTVALAALAWAASGDEVRAVAVLVVATPCPLILAAPIALVSGLSRSANAGIVLKGGTPLERLGAARTVLLDKTGTLTEGRPSVERVVVFGNDGNGDRAVPGEGGSGLGARGPMIDEPELLRLAASVDQVSAHALAEGIVRDASRRGLELTMPAHPSESPGDGVVAEVDGIRVGVGGESWLARQGFVPDQVKDGASAEVLGADPGQAVVHVGVDGRIAGVLLMADHLRKDAANLVDLLHAQGIERVAMVTGDRADVAEAVAGNTGLDRVYSEQTPEDKLEVVRAMRASPELRPVVMVGDGVNDAPALALADVGIAISGETRTVSTETADAVITVDRIDRVSEAVRIGQRTMAIARQSVVIGIGLSTTAMVVAAFGYLPPVAGALLQEVIDVGVILNALRVLRV